MVRLKKLSENPDSHILQPSSARYSMSQKLRDKIKRAKDSGKEINVKIFTTQATIKPEKKKAKEAKDSKKKKAQKEKEKKRKAAQKERQSKGKSSDRPAKK